MSMTAAKWVKLLKDDNKALFKAASLASKAADYLRAFSKPKEVANAEA